MGAVGELGQQPVRWRVRSEGSFTAWSSGVRRSGSLVRQMMNAPRRVEASTSWAIARRIAATALSCTAPKTGFLRTGR